MPSRGLVLKPRSPGEEATWGAFLLISPSHLGGQSPEGIAQFGCCPSFPGGREGPPLCMPGVGTNHSKHTTLKLEGQGDSALA